MTFNHLESDSVGLFESKASPSPQQIIAYRCRLLSQLADVLAPTQDSAATRKALRLIADELLDISSEVLRLDPEEESDLDEVLARFGS